MLNQVPQQGIRQPVLIGPLRIAKDPVKRMRVCLLDATQSGLERLTDIGSHFPHVPPMAAFRNLKAVVLREQRRLLIPLKLNQGRRVLLIVHIRQPFEEQQGKHVSLEVRRIHRSPQNIRGFPEMGFKLEKDQRHPESAPY